MLCSVHCLLAGDFQCNSGSRFFDQLSHLANDCNLTISDTARLNDTFTYFSDSGNCMSWIDHFYAVLRLMILSSVCPC